MINVREKEIEKERERKREKERKNFTNTRIIIVSLITNRLTEISNKWLSDGGKLTM